MVQEVVECFRHDKYELALEILEEVLQKEKNNRMALYQKGISLVKVRN